MSTPDDETVIRIVKAMREGTPIRLKSKKCEDMVSAGIIQSITPDCIYMNADGAVCEFTLKSVQIVEPPKPSEKSLAIAREFVASKWGIAMSKEESIHRVAEVIDDAYAKARNDAIDECVNAAGSELLNPDLLEKRSKVVARIVMNVKRS